MQVFGEGNNREMEAKIRGLLAAAHPEVTKIELDPDESAASRHRKPTLTRYTGVARSRTWANIMPGTSPISSLRIRPLTA